LGNGDKKLTQVDAILGPHSTLFNGALLKGDGANMIANTAVSKNGDAFVIEKESILSLADNDQRLSGVVQYTFLKQLSFPGKTAFGFKK
jgi:hypothetical protein